MKDKLLNHLNTVKILKSTDPLYKEMQKIAGQTREQIYDLNSKIRENDEIIEKLEEIFEKELPKSLRVFQPFYTDFGKNISIGNNTFINTNVQIQGQGGVYIGSGVAIGHQVILSTLDHGLEVAKRLDFYLDKIAIEDNVWIGPNSVITKGVTIGCGPVVGAGSVVTKDVMPHTVVDGNPARLIRHIEEK